MAKKPNNQPQTFHGWQDEIEDWAQMWDEMQGMDIHPPAAPKAEIAAWDEHDVDNPHDIYYSYIADLASREAKSEPYAHSIQKDDGLIQEDLRTPNPVYPDSAGPDHETTPPVWVSDKIVKEIQQLKDRLFELENKAATDLGGGKKWPTKPNKAEAVQKAPTPLSERIEKLRKEIEEVSSELGVEYEPSPWVVRRD
jgi:hypothetical protein